MKYFRTYPWGLQLLMFFLMVFTFYSAAGVIIISLIPKLTGILPAQIGKIAPGSPAALVNATLIVAGASNLCVFLLPAFVFAYLAHPQPRAYLGFRTPGKAIQPLLAILVMLGAMPVLESLSGLVSHINFGPTVAANEKANDEMMSTFLDMPSFAVFLKTFLILAVLPAIGEEMFFRGTFMRFVRKKTTGMAIPVVFTALIFSFAHSSVYGFIPIFLAGVLLAVIYNLTGSLWCSILAHLFFNGTQIILSYASNTNAQIKTFMHNTSIPGYYVAAGAAVFAISFYLLLKTKTPLPSNWAEDFDNPPQNFSWEENSEGEQQ